MLGLIPAFLGYKGLGLLLAFGLIGLAILRYPFATPQTISWLGVKRSVTLVRALGIVLVITGIVLALVVPNG